MIGRTIPHYRILEKARREASPHELVKNMIDKTYSRDRLMKKSIVGAKSPWLRDKT
jgi:hypothetical protein